jgi:hypothetical protein
MLRFQFPKSTLLAIGVLSCLWLTDAAAEHFQRLENLHNPPVTCREYQYGNPDLFYNFYAPPNCGGMAAGMYPAPLSSIPPHVGHVYYTYQPLMPHEFLYKHHRTYHRYYNDGRGLTRTSVRWW